MMRIVPSICVAYYYYYWSSVTSVSVINDDGVSPYKGILLYNDQCITAAIFVLNSALESCQFLANSYSGCLRLAYCSVVAAKCIMIHTPVFMAHLVQWLLKRATAFSALYSSVRNE
ncbi:hypothetical protein E2542_SST00486 [Spatholobus suberectus]|nr:hypothetical protein E2542_SST00486 [Spatholobus suberectus]